jgi:hypothetical protein
VEQRSCVSWGLCLLGPEYLLRWPSAGRAGACGDRPAVSRSSSSCARRSWSQVIGAWMSVCSRRGALPRQFCSAVRLVTRGRRRASRARRAAACASGKGRGVGRTASATWAHAVRRAPSSGPAGLSPGHCRAPGGRHHRHGPPGRGRHRHHSPLVASRSFADQSGLGGPTRYRSMTPR